MGILRANRAHRACFVSTGFFQLLHSGSHSATAILLLPCSGDNFSTKRKGLPAGGLPSEAEEPKKK